MKIEIKINALYEELTQANQSRIRRVATVLREEGFVVDIIYQEQLQLIEAS